MTIIQTPAFTAEDARKMTLEDLIENVADLTEQVSDIDTTGASWDFRQFVKSLTDDLSVFQAEIDRRQSAGQA